MLPFMSFAVSGICVLLPVALIFFVVISYNMAVGNIAVAGIAKEEMDAKKHWTTVPEITRKVGRFLALGVSAFGSLLALVGFLSPWVTLNVSAPPSLGTAGLNGDITGVGLFVKSIFTSFQVFSSDLDGAVFVGVFLLIIALAVFLIFIALLLSALTGMGIIAAPFGYVKRETSKLSGQIIIFGLIAIIFSCIFFASLQAVANGFEITSSSDLFEFNLSAGVTFASGFWYTFWGLLFTIAGAAIANRALGNYIAWIKNLTSLEPDEK